MFGVVGLRAWGFGALALGALGLWGFGALMLWGLWGLGLGGCAMNHVNQ